jgi:3-dehydroquinate dehydratase
LINRLRAEKDTLKMLCRSQDDEDGLNVLKAQLKHSNELREIVVGQYEERVRKLEKAVVAAMEERKTVEAELTRTLIDTIRYYETGGEGEGAQAEAAQQERESDHPHRSRPHHL